MQHERFAWSRLVDSYSRSRSSAILSCCAEPLAPVFVPAPDELGGEGRLLPGTHRARAADGFDLVVLGALGGIEDGNLSASLIHPHGDDRAVASTPAPW